MRSSEEILRFLRILRIVLVTALVLSLFNDFLVLLMLMSRYIVSFEGFLLNGYISYLENILHVAHEEMIARPLESVEGVSRVILVIAVVMIPVIIYVLIKVLKQISRDMYRSLVEISRALVYVFGIYVLSILILVAQISLTRVVITDILGSLPISYSIETSVGRFTLYKPQIYFSWIYDIYTKQNILLQILVLGEVILLILITLMIPGVIKRALITPLLLRIESKTTRPGVSEESLGSSGSENKYMNRSGEDL